MNFQFDHAAQIVQNIAEAVDWYRRVLPGATVLYQDETWAFVDAHGVRLAFVVKSQHPDHLAWRVSAQDLEALAEKHNAVIDTHRDGTRGFYLEAPGGRAVEIICVDGSPWAEEDRT